MKALEKDRARRYGSASEFAADIGRYLNHEPVLAVPPSVAYRARKFARRYRAALATACAFALVLIVAAVVSIRQGIRANREAASPQAVNDFLQNDLLAQASAANQSGPSAKPDPDLKVRTALDRAAARIAGKFDAAAGGGGFHSGHYRADLHGPRALPGGTQAIGAGAGFAPPGAGGRESEDPQNREPPWKYCRASR